VRHVLDSLRPEFHETTFLRKVEEICCPISSRRSIISLVNYGFNTMPLNAKDGTQKKGQCQGFDSTLRSQLLDAASTSSLSETGVPLWDRVLSIHLLHTIVTPSNL
jgi:hypothetical protein